MRRKGLLLVALVATAVVAAACGGGSAPASPATQLPTEVIPTQPPAGGSQVIQTPVPLTPTPAGLGGRADCPADWAVFNDPDNRFSLCYPATFRAITERPSPTGTAVQVEPSDFANARPEERVFLLASWRPSSILRKPGPSSLCAIFAQTGEVSRQPGEMTVGGVQAPTCLTQANEIDPGVGVSDRIDYYQLMVEVPRPSEGFVLIRGVYSGPDFEASKATLLQMLGSLAVEE